MRRLFATVVLSSVLASPLAGQAVADARVAAAARALRTESSIRIATTGRRVEGRFLRAESDSLALRTAAGERHIALAAVDTLWERQRGTGRGALIGAAVGGVALAAFGVFIVSALCDSGDGCGSDYPRVIGVGLVLGGAGGALVGSGVGALTHRWRRLYP
jgi:hypothetical protein